MDPRLDLFAWIRAHDMLDLRFLPYGTCQYHHTNTPGVNKKLAQDIIKIWRCLPSTMTKVSIVQSLDTGLQEGDCKTQKEDKMEPFDVIESVLLVVFRDRGHGHGEGEI